MFELYLNSSIKKEKKQFRFKIRNKIYSIEKNNDSKEISIFDNSKEISIFNDSKEISIFDNSKEISIFDDLKTEHNFNIYLCMTNLPLFVLEYYNNYNISKSLNTNIFSGEHKFYSINQILIQNKYLYNNSIPIIDFASKYYCMDWIIILYFDYIEQKYYMRYDGGSNNFEIKQNNKKLFEYYHYKYNINNKRKYTNLNLNEFEREIDLYSLYLILYPFLNENI